MYPPCRPTIPPLPPAAPQAPDLGLWWSVLATAAALGGLLSAAAWHLV